MIDDCILLEYMFGLTPVFSSEIAISGKLETTKVKAYPSPSQILIIMT